MKMLVKFWLQVCYCKQICEKIVLLFTWLSSVLKPGPSLSYISVRSILILACNLPTDDYWKVL